MTDPVLPPAELRAPFDLTGQVAVITGSSRGIGRAIACAMARMGAKVVVSARSEETCAPVAAALRDEGMEAVAIPCHLGREGQEQALIERAAAAFGPVSALVCNAAINPVYGPMEDLQDAAFAKIMDANVMSALRLARLVAPGMRAAGGGSVTFVSSIAGLRGTAMIGGYGLSKAADMALARNLALDWGPDGIRVNCIAPGLVKTEFARALWEDPARVREAAARTPLRRMGRPEDIGGIAAFLASPAAAFVTGQTLVADGGVTVA